ncbi:MAG TPA: ATP synthase F0 subunit B [Geobacteraceae bacterium]|nr:ATP synthase F0 subunit B [Geobacteraceae bacterium]
MINLDIVLLIQAINFLVLLFLLNILLYKPIRKILADRDAEIAASKKKTLTVDQDVREKMARYEQKLRDVKTDATEKRNAMIREAREEEAKVLEAARRDAAVVLSKVRESIEQEAAQAEALLKVQADSLSNRICEKVLGRSL